MNNMAEICGLQWKCLNFDQRRGHHPWRVDSAQNLAVREAMAAPVSGSVEQKKPPEISPIPAPLIGDSPDRAVGTSSSDDFVLPSRVGTPVNENQIAARR
jgi:hypothetical protein